MRGAGDPLLQLPHLGGEGRLVAHGARHAAEERGDFRARLHEAEDVVDEEQHVAPLDIAEVFGHRHARQADAQARARRLVHLAEDHHRLVDDAGVRHFMVEVVPLAGALAHTGEDGIAAVLRRDVADQFLQDDRLAGARAAEEAHLAAAA